MSFSILRRVGRRAGSRLILLVVLCAGAGRVPADIVPRFSQRIWDRASGLPANEVSGLCLDRTGYLWIATPTGLARFDGSRFLSYEFVRAGQAAVTRIAAIVGDPAGEGIWAAPYDGGLFRFRGGRFEEFSLPGAYSKQRVARLFASADAALWIAFEGGEVMRLKGGVHQVFGERLGLGPRRSSQLAADGAGRVWVANGRRLFWYEGDTLQALPVDEFVENVRITSSRQDGPWVLTRGVLNKVVNGRLAPPIPVNASFNARSVQSLLEDSAGAVWVGTRSHGVRRLLAPEQKSELAIEMPEDVGALLEDGSGNIWVGSNGGGLLRLRQGVVRLLDKSQGLLESHVLGVCEDNAGTLWIANRDGGVAFVNELDRVRALAPPRLRDTFSARSVAPAGAAGVFVTTSYGLLRAEQSGVLPIDAPGAPPQPPDHGEMRVTHLARNGDLWVDLDPGRIGRLRDGQWRVFTTEDGLGMGALQSITEDAEGRVWIGTEDTKLYRFDGTRFVPVELAAPAGAGSLQAIYFDANNVGWIGTAGAGLLRLGSATGRNLTERHGLPAKNISQVIGDDQGTIWFGSPDGIFHVRREELEQFFAGGISRVDAVSLSVDEGLVEANCAADHHPSVWKGRNGMLWFATRQGVVAIDPHREKLADLPLVARIDAVRDGDQRLPVAATVRVPPLNRTLELDYSVLCLSTPERVRARYRLHGYDDEWTVADKRGIARYARLPPGNYLFEVSARVAGVPSTGTTAALTLVVEAAWWQTWWFRIGAAGIALLLGAVGVRTWSHRRLRARLAQLEHASALERERARIAQNIHDELGSGLTRISLLTQSAEVTDGRVQLDRIYGTVSDLTQSMDEIVWAVNPKNDNLEGLANYVVEFAQGFLTDAGIRCRVALPDFFPAHPLTTQSRHHLFMACKEALNNVVKHAQATEVSLQIEVADDHLRIVIADNGCGREAAAAGVRVGNGLTNMHDRLAALGGTCEIVRAGGTIVTFSAPLSPLSVSQ